MDGSKAVEISDVTGVPVVRLRSSVARSVAPDIVHRLPPRWAWFAVLVGPAVAAFCITVEPPPADPNAAEPLAGALLALAFLLALVGAAVTGLRRRPRALIWASAVGVLAVAMTVTCPASGHHVSVGAWWVAQLVVSAGALAVALAGVQRVRSTSSSGSPVQTAA